MKTIRLKAYTIEPETKYNYVAPEDVSIDMLDFDNADEISMLIPFKNIDTWSMVHIENVRTGPVFLLQLTQECAGEEIKLNDTISRQILEKLKEEFPWYYQ